MDFLEKLAAGIGRENNNLLNRSRLTSIRVAPRFLSCTASNTFVQPSLHSESLLSVTVFLFLPALSFVALHGRIFEEAAARRWADFVSARLGLQFLHYPLPWNHRQAFATAFMSIERPK